VYPVKNSYSSFLCLIPGRNTISWQTCRLFSEEKPAAWDVFLNNKYLSWRLPYHTLKYIPLKEEFTNITGPTGLE
jgi:hypothetical protein